MSTIRIKEKIKSDRREAKLMQSEELPSSFSQIMPANVSGDLQIKFLIAYCSRLTKEVNKLKEHAKQLDKELDRDDEAKSELEDIYKYEKLERYYLKLCELSYYFLASKTITSQMVAEVEDMHEWTVRMAAEAAESAFHFIPVISGFSGIVKVGHEAYKIMHDITSHRHAKHIADWTNGLGENVAERLARRFARKLTLRKAENILNPSLKQHPKKEIVNQLRSVSTSIVGGASQLRRETKEGHTYTPEERLALADLLQILEAIGTNRLKPSVSGTEEEKMAERLQAMLTNMDTKPCDLSDDSTLIRSPTFYFTKRRDLSKDSMSLIRSVVKLG